ncbi:MAG: hypothetical protein AAFV07_05955, partial [Bacteroidota bacterium]
GHYGATRDGHNHPWYWYFNNLHVNRFKAFLPLLPFSLLVVFAKPFRKIRDLGIILLLGTLSVLIIISGSNTKLIWYDASAYPCMAMLAGLVLWQLHDAILARWQPAHPLGNTLASIGFGLIFFLYPYIGIIQQVYIPKHVHQESERYANLIWQTERNRPDIKSYIILHEGQSAHALFYQNVYNLTRDEGFNIRRIVTVESTKPGMTIMVCQEKIIWILYERFEIEVIQAWNGCQLVNLHPKEIPEPESDSTNISSGRLD